MLTRIRFGSSPSLGGNEVSLSYVTGVPDVSQINSSQLSVVFKSLLKRDSTTKEKALGELISVVSSENGPSHVDTDLQWVWVQLYPKLSIDSSRNVRQLAHKAQGLLCRILGKASSRYLKESIGPWVTGLYDTDKLVVIAAENALDLVFPTQEKKEALYKVFEQTLLEYIHNVIAVETMSSLSDERFVTKEEAEHKYYRTQRASVALLEELLKKDTKKHDQDYLNTICESKLWKGAYSEDVALSRSVLSLSSTLVSTRLSWAEKVLKELGHSVVYRGLEKCNSAVLTDLLQSIIILTQALPCWQYANGKKKTGLDVLIEFIRQGSRRSGKYFWPSVLKLLSTLPAEISPYSDSSPEGTSQAIANSVLEGIQKEMVVHLGGGWGSYLAVVEKIQASGVKESQPILRNALFNVIKTLIFQEGETLDRDVLTIVGRKISDLWALDGQSVSEECGRLLNLIALEKLNKAYFKKFLFTIKVTFDNLKTQQDKERLLAYVDDYLSNGLGQVSAQDEFQIYTIASILPAFDSYIFDYDPKLIESVGQFLTRNLADCIVSDAAADVLQILKQYTLHNKDPAADETIQESIELAFNSVVKLSNLDQRSSLFPLILKEYAWFRGRTKPIPLASEYLLSVYSSIDSWEITNDWDSILFGISSHGIFVSEDVAFDILRGVSNLQLVRGKNVEKAIWTFNNLLKLDRPYFMKFIESNSGKDCVSNLWKLAEDHPEAESILGAIESNATVLPRELDIDFENNKTLESLTDGLLSEVERSDVEGVEISVQRGQRLLDQIEDPKDKLYLFQKLLFYTNGTWEKKLQLLFGSGGVAAPLAVSNPLGGAIFFMNELNDEGGNLQIIPDELISMSIFSICLIAGNRDLFGKLPVSVQLELMVSLALVSEASTDYAFLAVIEHENGIGGENLLSDAIIAFSEDVCAILLDGLKGFGAYDAVDAIVQVKDQLDDDKPVTNLISQLWKNSVHNDPKGYYSARVLAFIFEYLVNRPSIGKKEAEELFELVSPSIHKYDHPLGAAAILLGFQRFLFEIPTFDKLRNKIASDLVAVGNEENVLPAKFMSLVYLNILLTGSNEEELGSKGELIPVNRLVMCLNSLFKCCQSDEAYEPSFLATRVEITKLLSRLIPLYKDLPKSIFEQTVELLEQDFVQLDNSTVALEYYTLKTFNVLVNIQETHADLSEIWMDKQADLYYELLDVLFRATASANKARSLTNIQLQRAVSTTPLTLIEEPEKFYALLAVPSFEIQRAAFILLHELIPSNQEERSIELQLSRQKIGSEASTKDNEQVVEDSDLNEDSESQFGLPVELLSLLLDTPVRGAPGYDITRYLWSWMLIYDHFPKATYDLRKIYIQQLKECGHLDTMMNFISERIVNGELSRVLDRMNSKEQAKFIKSYGTIDQPLFETPTEEIEALMVHLYYTALQFTGSLVKTNWYLALKKRQTSLAVEKFTEKYISPVIVEDELDTVEQMLSQTTGLMDDNMSAKISRPLKEVKAFYTIDEQTMEIAVRMPSLYPLKDIQVEGIKRIGVRERQWRAWLLASQAIGTAQNGTIVDTLELFKRNVSLHFEGVAECAICYSILHQDHSLPTKTCGTCKNKFHANCLYKWFKSASSSSCPLCRTNFSFRIGK